MTLFGYGIPFCNILLHDISLSPLPHGSSGVWGPYPHSFRHDCETPSFYLVGSVGEDFTSQQNSVVQNPLSNYIFLAVLLNNLTYTSLTFRVCTDHVPSRLSMSENFLGSSQRTVQFQCKWNTGSLR